MKGCGLDYQSLAYRAWYRQKIDTKLTLGLEHDRTEYVDYHIINKGFVMADAIGLLHILHMNICSLNSSAGTSLICILDISRFVLSTNLWFCLSKDRPGNMNYFPWSFGVFKVLQLHPILKCSVFNWIVFFLCIFYIYYFLYYYYALICSWIYLIFIKLMVWAHRYNYVQMTSQKIIIMKIYLMHLPWTGAQGSHYVSGVF